MGLFDFFNKGKKRKKIALYVLSNVYELDENNIPHNMIVYTVTSTLKDCQEYLDMLLYAKHISHYNLWCELYEYDAQSEITWNEYKGTVLIEELNDYMIFRSYYTLDKIATIMRMFNHCQPLGCSFENDVEFKYFVENLDLEVREQLEKELNEYHCEGQVIDNIDTECDLGENE